MHLTKTQIAGLTAPLSGLLLTREQVVALVNLIRAVAQQNVEATPSRWDDLIFGLVDSVVFSQSTIDKICAWLGVK